MNCLVWNQFSNRFGSCVNLIWTRVGRVSFAHLACRETKMSETNWNARKQNTKWKIITKPCDWSIPTRIRATRWLKQKTNPLFSPHESIILSQKFRCIFDFSSHRLQYDFSHNVPRQFTSSRVGCFFHLFLYFNLNLAPVRAQGTRFSITDAIANIFVLAWFVCQVTRGLGVVK